MAEFIPYSRQNIAPEDIEAVVRVLKSPLITQGPEVERFEEAIAGYCGVKYAVAFNSGTSALHAALHAAGITAGDEVITTPLTFLATVNAAVYLGAHPVMMDIDPRTYCLDVNQIEALINEKTRAVLPVDYAGYPVDMNAIREVARRHQLIVIEDAAHALGAIRNGQAVGGEADMTMFSFHPVKHITTGEGGMIVTNDAALAGKMRRFRNHGMIREADQLLENHGPWYYEMQEPGYNFRMTSIQAALGLSQFQRLEAFVEERNELARVYDQAFTDFPALSVPPRIGSASSRHAYHLYPLLVNDPAQRLGLFTYLRQQGIGVQVHYLPVHLQPFYRRQFGYQPGQFPMAEFVYWREISIPLFPGLTPPEQSRVVDLIKDYLAL